MKVKQNIMLLNMNELEFFSSAGFLLWMNFKSIHQLLEAVGTLFFLSALANILQ